MAKKIEVNENWEPVEVEDLDNLFVVIFKQGSFDQGYVEAFDTDDVLMQSAYDSLAKQYDDCGCDELTKIYLIKVPNTDQTVDMCNTGLFNGSSCDPHVIEATRDLFNRADCEHLSCWEGCGLTEAKKKKNFIPGGYLTITTGDPALNIKHFNKCMGTDGLGDPADHPHLVVGDTLPNGPVAGEGSGEASGEASGSAGEGWAVGESLNEAQEGNLEEKVRSLIKNYFGEDKSRLSILEYDDGYDGFVEKFDDGEIDFGKFIYNDLSDEEIEEGKPVITFLLSGGLNGSGKWEDYLKDLASLFKQIKKELGLHAIVYKIETDILDDVWTAEVLLYVDRDEAKESLNEDLIIIEPFEAKEKIEEIKAQIEESKDWKVRKNLLTLMNIYLFQTIYEADHQDETDCDINKEEWDKYSEWRIDQDEKLLNEHPELEKENEEREAKIEASVKDDASDNAGDSIGDVDFDESLNEGVSSAIDAIAAKYGTKLDRREKTNDKTKYFIEVPFKDKRYWQIWDELKTLNPESMDSWKTGIVVTLDVESEINLAKNKQIMESSGFSYFYEQVDKMQKLENRLNGDHNPATSRDFNAKAASDGKLKINREICIQYGLWKALKVVEDEMIRRNLISSYYKVKKDRIDMSIIVDADKLKAIADLLFLFNASELNAYIDKNVNKSFEDAICILLITLRSNNAKISTEIKDKILNHYDITVQELINILQKNLNAAELANILSVIPAARLKEDLKLYRYNGPIYAGGNKVVDIWDDSSKAVSPEKALNNIRYKAGKKLGDDGIELVPEYLSMVNIDDDGEIPMTVPQKPVKKCKDCGAILMDSGECPNCDYGDSSALELDESKDLLEAKRYVKRYYVRPLNIFCGNKEDIIQALIRAGDQNCSVYSLKNLDDHEDVHLLQPSDIIYYWDDRVLYDKNHVQVMDYDLFVKHEEERKKVGNVNALSDATFSDMYDDRATEDDLKDKEVIANYKALNKISR